MSTAVKQTVTRFDQLAVTANDRLAKLPIDTLARDLSGLMSELRSSNKRFSDTLAAFPVEGIGRNISLLVGELRESNQRLAKALADPKLTNLSAQASTMVETTTAAFGRLHEILDNPELGRAISKLQRSVGRLERILVGREGDIATTLENLRIISDNLRDTTETAKNYPSQILFGEPPAAATSPRR
ncbi:MAG: hypothetical protein EXR39_11005 [Betaproteobacteria bacterium]|nr:hypothetical protein [Betaproteobacteria bacterium]